MFLCGQKSDFWCLDANSCRIYVTLFYPHYNSTQLNIVLLSCCIKLRLCCASCRLSPLYRCGGKGSRHPRGQLDSAVRPPSGPLHLCAQGGKDSSHGPQWQCPGYAAATRRPLRGFSQTAQGNQRVKITVFFSSLLFLFFFFSSFLFLQFLCCCYIILAVRASKCQRKIELSAHDPALALCTRIKQDLVALLRQQQLTILAT